MAWLLQHFADRVFTVVGVLLACARTVVVAGWLIMFTASSDSRGTVTATRLAASVLDSQRCPGLWL